MSAGARADEYHRRDVPVLAPPFSVIVPACKEAAVIRRCIAAIQNGMPVAAELDLIIAVNGSSDGTAQIASEAAPDAQVIELPEPSKARAINQAFAHCRNPIRIVVDADVIKPSVTERFGIEGARGLMDALAEPSILPESLVIRTDIEGLFVLPAGTATARDAEYLASSRTAAVLDRLTAGAPDRIVIFDTPPALAASPAAELAKHVGQALLVVRADETSRAALEDAQQLLSACGDIKLLLNATRYSPSGRRFGSYGTKGK